MASRKADVIVVGAGPAGCAAAFDLARAGLDVLLLDRRSFPRVKPCGGALTVKAIRALRFSIAPVVRAVITDVVGGRELTRSSRLSSPRPISVMTVREELDAFVLGKTLKAGARFAKIGRVTEIRQARGSVRVVTQDEQLTARFLVGADGANSTVRRLCGLPPQQFGFAIEGQVAASAAGGRSVRIDFGVVPRGFGWVFPKGDHLNVGVYTYDARFPLFPQQLRWYARASLGREDVSHLVGSPIGMGGWAREPRRGRVFLAGDAAGFCEPVLGEGIYYAIASGQIAAAAILAEPPGRRPRPLGIQIPHEAFPGHPAHRGPVGRSLLSRSGAQLPRPDVAPRGVLPDEGILPRDSAGADPRVAARPAISMTGLGAGVLIGRQRSSPRNREPAIGLCR